MDHRRTLADQLEHAALQLETARDAWRGNLVDLPELVRVQDEAITRLREAATLLRWQPISTAPKDGTRMLGCSGSSVMIVVYRRGSWESDAGEYCSPPTHWQPLPPHWIPAPPVAAPSEPTE